MKKSIVESLNEREIELITKCLKSMGNTWGEEGTPSDTARKNSKTTTTTTTTTAATTKPRTKTTTRKFNNSISLW